MKTKAQKVETIKNNQELFAKSRLLVFLDFSGLKTKELNNLRKLMKPKNVLKVIKKRLLKFSLKEKNVDFDPKQFEAQLAVIFSSQDLSEIAGPVYKFSNENFKILGAYDLVEKKFIDPEVIKFIGQLPSKEVLLAQLIGILSAPLRMFLYVLNEKAKTQ